MRFYHALFSDTAVITGPYFIGSNITAVGNDGAERSWTVQKEAPAWGLYIATEDNAQCGPPAEYYRRSVPVTFTGTVGSPAARVVENVACEQLPIQTVFDRQKSNLDGKRDQVLAQGVTVTTSTGVHDLQSAGQMITQYWSTNIWTLPAATEVTTVTLHEEGVAIKGTDLDDIATQIGLLYAAANGNWLALLDEMKALLAADDWLGLANFDIDRGWPAAPGNGSAEQVDISLLGAVVDAPAFHARTGGVPEIAALWAHLNANLPVRADPQELLRRWNAR